ncbi:MAG: alpha/beta fold hydrolase [Solirubrobacteraceae bacterium]
MRLPYDEAGEGDAVVLLHAGVGDRRMWQEHLEPLAAAGYRALAMDLPGFGDAPPSVGLEMPWADVVETMDAAGVRRASMVGNSFGGAVALRVAVVAPERVRALMLISAPDAGVESSPSPELRAAWDAEEAAIERGDVDAAVEAVISAWTLPDAPAQLRTRVAAMQRQALVQQLSAAPAREAADPLDEHPEAVGHLDIPTLVVAGEHDVADFRDAARRLRGALPQARHLVLEAAGHLAPLETPEALRALLLDFLSAAPGDRP